MPLQKHHTSTSTCHIQCVFFSLVQRTRHHELSNFFTARAHCPFKSTTLAHQPAAYSAFLFFLGHSQNPTIITMQIYSFVTVIVFQALCDLVTLRLGPMIRARFLFLLYHRPMHDGSSSLRDLVATRLGPMIRVKFLFLLYHRPMHDGSSRLCDLVTTRLGPMIWAKFLFILYHCPMHGGNLLLNWCVSLSISAGSLWIFPMSISLFYHQERACSWLTLAAVTLT